MDYHRQSIPYSSGICRNNVYHSNDGGMGGSLGNPEVSGHHLPQTGKYRNEKELDEFCRLQQYPNDHMNLQTALHMASPLLAYDHEEAEDVSTYQQERLQKMHSKPDKGGNSRAMLTNSVVGAYKGVGLPVDRDLKAVSREQAVKLSSSVPHVGRSSSTPSYIQAAHLLRDVRHQDRSSDGMLQATQRLEATAKREKRATKLLHGVGGYANAGMAPGRTLDAVGAQGQVVSFRRANHRAKTDRRRLSAAPRAPATQLDVHSRVVAANITAIVGEQSDNIQKLNKQQTASTSRVQELERNLAQALRAAEEQKLRGDNLEEQLLSLTLTNSSQATERRSVSPTEALYARMLRDSEARAAIQQPSSKLQYSHPNEDEDPVEGQPLNTLKSTPSAHQARGAVRPDHAAITLWAEATPRIDYDTAQWIRGDSNKQSS